MNRIAFVSNSPNLIKFVLLRLGHQTSSPLFFENVDSFLRWEQVSSILTVFLDFDLGRRQIDHLLRYVTTHRNSHTIVVANVPRVDQIRNELISKGIDDVIFNSLQMLELIDKIKIESSRTESTAAVASIRIGDILLRRLNRSATVAQQDILLTEKEFQLLWILASRLGENVGRAELASSVWKRPMEFCVHSIEQYVHRIRKKLSLDGRHNVRIKTVYNGGYRIEELDRSGASDSSKKCFA